MSNLKSSSYLSVVAIFQKYNILCPLITYSSSLTNLIESSNSNHTIQMVPADVNQIEVYK